MRTEDYLVAIFKWSWIISQCLKFATQEFQQYEELMAEFEEQKHLYYQNIYQQGYSDGHAS